MWNLLSTFLVKLLHSFVPDNFLVEMSVILRLPGAFRYILVQTGKYPVLCSQRLVFIMCTRPLTVPNGCRWMQSSVVKYFIFCGPAAQRRPRPPHSWGSWIIRNDASQSVGWKSDQLVAEASTNNTQTSIPPGGLRTHNPSQAEWPQTCALDRAVTGTGSIVTLDNIIFQSRDYITITIIIIIISKNAKFPRLAVSILR